MAFMAYGVIFLVFICSIVLIIWPITIYFILKKNENKLSSFQKNLIIFIPWIGAVLCGLEHVYNSLWALGAIVIGICSITTFFFLPILLTVFNFNIKFTTKHWGITFLVSCIGILILLIGALFSSEAIMTIGAFTSGILIVFSLLLIPVNILYFIKKIIQS